MKKLAHTLAFLTLTGAIAAGIGAGCGGSGQIVSTGGDTCQAGTFRNCNCDLATGGTQACAADGSGWEACDCGGVADAGSDAAPACGDQVCNGSETCATCPADCGQCAACSVAPSCTGASSVPSSPTALDAFDNAGQAVYTSGVGFSDGQGATLCSEPLLKMRLSQIKIHKNGSSHGLELFCMIQADDGQSSQLLVSPDYMNLEDDNAPLVLSPATGTFWGQAVNGVKLSQFNITVTYQCFMVTTPGALQNALDAIAGFAGAASAIPGNPYGWAFGLGGAAAAAAAAASATGNGATPLLNVQQTIDAGALLKLTNGYTWKIQQNGSTEADGQCGFFDSCDWDWELGVEAWGCAAPAGETPM